MLKRKFYDTLLAWKKTKRQECLLVNGARQVGKTFIIDKFGKENYGNYIYLNFIKNPEYRNIFEGSLEPVEIYKKMSLYVPDLNLKESDTLVFLDEIQQCKRARSALKFLAIDNRFDFIASGSLLGVRYKENDDSADEISIPVGYERELEMYSLDFEEFLWAVGVTENAIDVLRGFFDSKTKLDSSINERYLNLLREYMVVGGMPEAVNTFIETSSYKEVYNAQQKLLNAYKDDIEHYAKNTEKPKIISCYNSIPRQLAKEYTKFQYKTVDKQGSARKYGNSIDWLADAGLVKQLYNVSLPQMPLKAYENPDEFKIYATDIGLTTSMFGFETQAALLGKTLAGPAKGGIYENLVFDILNKKGLSLWYFKRDKGQQEIEFVFEKDGKVIPVEVKSGRGSTESLNNFIKAFSPPYAYKLIDGNIGSVESKITIPQYMSMFI